MKITRRQLRQLIKEEVEKVSTKSMLDTFKKQNLETAKRIAQGEDLSKEFSSDMEHTTNLIVSDVDMELGNMTVGNAAWQWELAFFNKKPPEILSRWETSDSTTGVALDDEGQPLMLQGPDLYRLLKSNQVIVKL